MSPKGSQKRKGSQNDPDRSRQEVPVGSQDTLYRLRYRSISSSRGASFGGFYFRWLGVTRASQPPACSFAVFLVSFRADCCSIGTLRCAKNKGGVINVFLSVRHTAVSRFVRMAQIRRRSLGRDRNSPKFPRASKWRWPHKCSLRKGPTTGSRQGSKRIPIPGGCRQTGSR